MGMITLYRLLHPGRRVSREVPESDRLDMSWVPAFWLLVAIAAVAVIAAIVAIVLNGGVITWR
jgi:hypothetical protein